MEIKMKEKVDVNTYVFKKKVIDEALELLGRRKNYVINDVRFITMITFVNNLVENNLIIESLYDEANLEKKLLEEVEPLFRKEVLEKEERLNSFEDIVGQLIDYMGREVERRQNISGFLYDLFEDLGGLNMDELMKIVGLVMDRLGLQDLKSAKTPNKPKKTDEEIKADALKDIENAKMKALIEKYARQESEEKDVK